MKYILTATLTCLVPETEKNHYYYGVEIIQWLLFISIYIYKMVM